MAKKLAILILALVPALGGCAVLRAVGAEIVGHIIRNPKPSEPREVLYETDVLSESS